MRSARIGLVLSGTPAYSETFFRWKINGLSAAGFHVVLFARGKKDTTLSCKQIRPYPVFRSSILRMICVALVVPFLFLRSYSAARRFCKLERKRGSGFDEIIRRLYLNAHILDQKLDWLHFGFATMAIAREQVAGAIGAKMAVSFRGYDINVYPLKHPGCYHDLWKSVDKVHSISGYLLEKVHSLGMHSEKPATIITPAVNIAPLARNSFEFHAPIRIVTIARLHWIKGLEYAIQAIAKLRQKGLQVVYTIIGEGMEREKLLFEIDDLGVSDEVKLIGRLSHEETILKLKESDIYLQPSLNEGFCNSVLEAQAYGCLSIVSDVGALPENVLQGITGWVVPPRNALALADAILAVVQRSSEERAHIAAVAHQRVKREFTLQVHLEAWKDFYTTENNRDKTYVI